MAEFRRQQILEKAR